MNYIIYKGFNMLKSDFKKLLESETEKSNAAQALRGISDKCAKVANDFSSIKLKDLQAVIKTLKLNSSNDISVIENVQSTVSDLLQQMIDTCMQASNKIDDLSYEIMGDLKMSDASLEKVEDELGLDDEVSEEEIDLDTDSDIDLDQAGQREMK